MDQKSFFYFLIGESIHEGIQNLLKSKYPNRFTSEKRIKYKKIVVARPDVYDLEQNTIVEIKTTQKTDIEQPYPHHLTQLKTYMAIMKKDIAYITYFLYTNNPYSQQNLSNENDWIFLREFEVTLSEGEANNTNRSIHCISRIFMYNMRTNRTSI